MANRTKPGLASGAVAILAAPWGIYSSYKSVEDLPGDVGSLAQMLADPPFEMPWLIFAIAVVILTWSLWPRAPREESEAEPSAPSIGPNINQRTTGPNSPTFAGPVRDVHIYPSPAATQERKHPHPQSRSGVRRAVERMIAQEANRCPEWPVWRAVEHVATVVGDADDAHCFPEARRQLRQAAAEGAIRFWGQRDTAASHFKDDRHNSLWTPIEQDYWRDYKFNAMATGSTAEDQHHTTFEEFAGKRGARYWQVKVDKRAVERYWQRPPETTNDGKP